MRRDKRDLLSAAILLLFRVTERAGFHARRRCQAGSLIRSVPFLFEGRSCSWSGFGDAWGLRPDVRRGATLFGARGRWRPARPSFEGMIEGRRSLVAYYNNHAICESDKLRTLTYRSARLRRN